MIIIELAGKTRRELRHAHMGNPGYVHQIRFVAIHGKPISRLTFDGVASVTTTVEVLLYPGSAPDSYKPMQPLFVERGSELRLVLLNAGSEPLTFGLDVEVRPTTEPSGSL